MHLSHIHLQQHQAFLNQNEEIKLARKNALKYDRMKSVIDHKQHKERPSCSNLVRRTKSYSDIDEKINDRVTEANDNNQYPQTELLTQSTSSWSYVGSASTRNSSWDSDFGHLPPIPFSNQPLKMRYIPSVKPEFINDDVFTGDSRKSSPQFFKRRRSEILQESGIEGRKLGRSYQTLKNLSDVNRLSEQDKSNIRDKVLSGKKQILGMYTESLKVKIEDFHRDMDSFKKSNEANKRFKFERIRRPPKIY